MESANGSGFLRWDSFEDDIPDTDVLKNVSKELEKNKVFHDVLNAEFDKNGKLGVNEVK